jgi:hypothetical protein
MDAHSKNSSPLGSDDQSTDNLSHPTDLSDVPECAQLSKIKKLEDQRSLFDNVFNKPKRKLKDSEVIIDSQGVFALDKDVEEYMKARKRKQNRESATKSRMTKKVCIAELEEKLKQLVQENSKLSIENASLKSENTVLKSQIKFFEGIFSKQQMAPVAEKQQEETVTINGENDVEFMGLTRKSSTSSFIGIFSVVCIFSVLCIVSNSYTSIYTANTGATVLKGLKKSMPFYYYLLHPYAAIISLLLMCSYVALKEQIHKYWKKLVGDLTTHTKLS